MGSSGCLVQAVIPAMAREAPINFKNPRRETSSSHSDAPLGNSRCIISLNSVLPANSSRLRQNSGPLVSAMRARTVSRSSLSFLLGQTASWCGLPFCSSIFIFSLLAMTRGATRNIGLSAQMVFRSQIGSERELVGVSLSIHGNRLTARRWLIPHIEDLVSRAQIFLRRAMTVDAPLHLQRSVVKHQRHAVHRPVAGVASDALVDVNAVIEINEIRKIVDPGPNQRLARAVTFAHRLQQLRSHPHLRVAVHAGLGGGDPGKVGGLDRGMAVTAVNAQPRDVVLMAKGDRLGTGHAGES